MDDAKNWSENEEKQESHSVNSVRGRLLMNLMIIQAHTQRTIESIGEFDNGDVPVVADAAIKFIDSHEFGFATRKLY